MINDPQGLANPLRYCWTGLQSHENGVQKDEKNNEMLHRWQVNEFFNFDTPLGAVFDLHGGHEFTQEKGEISSIQEKPDLVYSWFSPTKRQVYTPPIGLEFQIQARLKEAAQNLKGEALGKDLEPWDKIA
jgi:hypothetical protein